MTDKITTLNFNISGHDLEMTLLADDCNLSDQDLLVPFQHNMVPEQDVLRFVLDALRAGDYVVDGGANIGFYTIIMSKIVGEYGHVTAFEPDAHNVKKLRHNLKLNDCNNVTVCTQPLWAERLHKKFNLCEHTSWGSFLNKPFGEAPTQSVDCITVALDEISGPLRLIKLDIEGAELPALCGAATHLTGEKRCPFIICELNFKMLKQLQIDQHVLFGLMRGHGYEVFLLRPDSNPVHIVKGARVFATDIEEDKIIFNMLFSTSNPIQL